MNETRTHGTLTRSGERSRRRERGFTLVELLVGDGDLWDCSPRWWFPAYLGRERKARSQAARTQIELFGTALDTFRLDVGRYPSSQEGLDRPERGPRHSRLGRAVSQEGRAHAIHGAAPSST